MYRASHPKDQIQQQTNRSSPRPTCQICGKSGHSALSCWHRYNSNYNSPPVSNTRAYLTPSQNTPNNEWILDSGASAHLTPVVLLIPQPTSYQGSDSVSKTSGSSLPIHHSGSGILPLPETNRKLKLTRLLHVPSISHNLLSISKLVTDNQCSVSFDHGGFVIKDL
ncbi:hypothetical protein MA16_Dca023642 [Dendrobium catenatum]|uniref:Retrovirus-related Pol polyprotein from transposon TNT 1-94-like beta-barrel domain-containing protein n=1 Tax=Dendrobium catenatum TaxID=906689 RepID=A0A2I0X5Y0_9ASPA|nr:hypothetical protein MA16_Dca023642 [Dendrobium catenatum]